MAFNVFKAQEMVAKSSQQARLQQKAAALRPLVTPPHEQGKSMRFHPTRAQSKLALPGVCYKCSTTLVRVLSCLLAAAEAIGTGKWNAPKEVCPLCHAMEFPSH